MIPPLRIRPVNGAPVRRDGNFILYWMIAARRTRWNFALERAVEWCEELGKSLIVFEPLRAGHEWASDRIHAFVAHGMEDNARELEGTGVLHFPYLEPQPGAGKGLLEALAAEACVVVTDEFPCFFLPRMVAAAGKRLPVRLEAVDGNGLLPLQATDHAYPTAYSFRSFLQKQLPLHLEHFPKANPLARKKLPARKALPAGIRKQWPSAKDWSALPIDHRVPPVSIHGGHAAAERRLRQFLDEDLERYSDEGNEPDAGVTSRLSPWLHFGHISAHEVFARLMDREGWSRAKLPGSMGGKRSGWWQVGASAEQFLDQLVTWRELGHHFCHHRADYAAFDSLPDWARKTLAEHAQDPREYCYTLRQFERAETHDELWNAAQRQLLTEGQIHNYLRMLWGKKILHWSKSPQEALKIMLQLNDKYALDGRDPNSYSGIFWVLGRFDRAWGPEREIFGKIRYMTSENTRRKLRVNRYLERYSAQTGLF